MSDLDLSAAFRKIGELEDALEKEREYSRKRQYPEPFKVGAVLGRYKNKSYALQILHVWNNWPNVDIEVALPFAVNPSSEAK
jgi:hypothetical protein